MKRISYGDADFLVGDEAADAVVEYAVLMAKLDTADSVQLAVLGPDGNSETASFVIGPATHLMVETTRSELGEPDNSEALHYLKMRTQELTGIDTALFEGDLPHHRWSRD